RLCLRAASHPRGAAGPAPRPAESEDLPGPAERQHATRLGRPLLGALLDGLLLLAEVERRIDEGHMGEGLREVAEEAARGRIVLLSEQAHVVGELEQPLEQLQRLAPAALQAEVVREPETAGEKHAFPRRQAV